MSQEIAGRFRLGVTLINIFDTRAVAAITGSTSGAPTKAIGSTSYQYGYGQADQFNFLPPRAFMVDGRVKF